MNLSPAPPLHSQWDALISNLDPISADFIIAAFYHIINELEGSHSLSLLDFTPLYTHTFALYNCKAKLKIFRRRHHPSPPPLPPFQDTIALPVANPTTPYSAPHKRVLILRNSARNKNTTELSPVSDASSAYPEVSPGAYCGFPDIAWDVGGDEDAGCEAQAGEGEEERTVRGLETDVAGEELNPLHSTTTRLHAITEDQRTGSALREEKSDAEAELVMFGVLTGHVRGGSDTTMGMEGEGDSVEVSPASTQSSLYPDIDRDEYCGFEVLEEGEEGVVVSLATSGKGDKKEVASMSVGREDGGFELWDDGDESGERKEEVVQEGKGEDSPALGARFKALCMDGSGQKKEAMKTVALGGGKGGRVVIATADENEVAWSPCERKVAKWMDVDGSSCHSQAAGRLGVRAVRKPLAEIC
ncbi:hypothetical protein BU16DRAFT_600784 [Lophium mytilinum]|uniref:Uncharacterized protein n=1 Tax=Lophium mytilinum TaxID=390894 RepID=A0A6A6Q848_9PEZI|nr:hypothetical protein BU16DRAFT_600784 [Lophium mytilinum]